MEQYKDLYIRDNFQDTGTAPSTGFACVSPDIIPYQGNILKLNYAKQTYNGPDISKDIINGGVNNIYIRAKNLGGDNETGRVKLYFTDASILLKPINWQPLSGPGGAEYVQFVYNGSELIPAGEIALTKNAFLLTQLPGNKHYCFIAIVDTPKDPAPALRNFTSDADYVSWVQNNHSVGWHNFNYQNSNVKTFTQYLTFGTINSYDTNCFIFIKGKNFESGSTITLQCTDQSCSFTYNRTFSDPDPVTGEQTVWINPRLPAKFNGILTAVVSSKNNFSNDAILTIDNYEVANTSNELDMKISKQFTIFHKTENGLTSENLAMFKLGGYTIILRDQI